MKKQKLTPWFDKSTTPVRAGAYETTQYGIICFHYWNGAYWGQPAFSAKTAAEVRHEQYNYQEMAWRGVTKP